MVDVPCAMCHVPRRTSHVACRTSHVARGTSHVARRTSHVARRTWHVARAGSTHMGRILDDLREAARSLRKQPRFLLIASLTLALGIGAVTAIFSVVKGVLLEPLPYAHADRLVNVWSTAP